MAIPSGSGTEVIKTTQLVAVTNSVRTLITGVADHIYTVLSIIVTETSEAAGERIDMYLADSDGTSNKLMIIYDMPINPFEIFVWNDKFSYTGGTQKLQIIAKSAANFDVICTYIDQDWS